MTGMMLRKTYSACIKSGKEPMGSREASTEEKKKLEQKKEASK